MSQKPIENKKTRKLVVEITDLDINEYDLEKAVKKTIKDNLSLSFTTTIYFDEKK